MTPKIHTLPTLLLGLLLSGCGHLPFGASPATPATGLAVTEISAAPEGCGPQPTVTAIPRLRLPGTESPRVKASTDKSLDLAQVHTVNRPLQEAGVWADVEGGWSVLSLELGSTGARTLAVRLREASLPERSEIWLCSLDRSVRQGPYREVTDGELWTPVVPGSEALIQVWLPTNRKGAFRALLADAYGGYR